MALLRKLLMLNSLQISRFQKNIQFNQEFLRIIKYNRRYFADEKMSTKTALVVLSSGSEEMEFTITTSILRRGGINVTAAGLCGTDPIKCSRDIVIKPDIALECVKTNKYDVIVMPGGLGGAKAMADSKLLGELLKQQENENRLIAAICAAPTVLAAHNIGHGKTITSYPTLKSQLEDIYCYKDDDGTLSVRDKNLITSRGPSTAFHFALTILEALSGLDKAKEVAKAVLYNYK